MFSKRMRFMFMSFTYSTWRSMLSKVSRMKMSSVQPAPFRRMSFPFRVNWR